MSAMKNLDLMVQDISVTPNEYAENKTLISMHFNGELSHDELPQHIKDVLFQWETEEIELNCSTEPCYFEEAGL